MLLLLFFTYCCCCCCTLSNASCFRSVSFPCWRCFEMRTRKTTAKPKQTKRERLQLQCPKRNYSLLLPSLPSRSYQVSHARSQHVCPYKKKQLPFFVLHFFSPHFAQFSFSFFGLPFPSFILLQLCGRRRRRRRSRRRSRRLLCCKLQVNAPHLRRASSPWVAMTCDAFLPSTFWGLRRTKHTHTHITPALWRTHTHTYAHVLRCAALLWHISYICAPRLPIQLVVDNPD